MVHQINMLFYQYIFSFKNQPRPVLSPLQLFFFIRLSLIPLIILNIHIFINIFNFIYLFYNTQPRKMCLCPVNAKAIKLLLYCNPVINFCWRLQLQLLPTDCKVYKQTDRHLPVWMTMEDRVSNVSWLKPPVGLKQKIRTLKFISLMKLQNLCVIRTEEKLIWWIYTDMLVSGNINLRSPFHKFISYFLVYGTCFTDIAIWTHQNTNNH